MLSFYVEDFGLREVKKDENYTALGTQTATEPLLILHDDQKASNPPRDGTGLYHYALLVPDRRSLAAAYLTLGERGVVFDGYADHLVSEALYLTDPDGNGIEIYHDRPRRKWKFDETGVVMATEPLDLDSLITEVSLSEAASLGAIANGTGVGHVHLKVSNLQTSVAFYREALGFELIRSFGSAAFLSAGGYHHHVGLNTWESLGGPTADQSWCGLEYATILIPQNDLVEIFSRVGESHASPNGASRLMVSDPDNINLILRAL
jgi:catechol 2,3-dioxygenase